MSTQHWHSEPMVLRIANAIARYIGFGPDDTTTSISDEVVPAPAPTSHLRLMATPIEQSAPTGQRWRRHPQLRTWESPISTDVRNGRHEAVRGLCAARAGAMDVAGEHFVRAAACTDIDLTAVPGFWNLTRGQMQAAVSAYESVGRWRDAAALDAQIATIFRPSLVGVELEPVAPRARQQAAST